jgi:nitric oxide reductase subunit B
MQQPSSKMLISSLWFQVSLLTFAIGFAVLGYLAYRINAEHPPIPARVVAPDGRVLFTGEDIMGGQHVFQKHGLMQHGTIFGHGAYLGQDFNAQYLHRGGFSDRRNRLTCRDRLLSRQHHRRGRRPFLVTDRLDHLENLAARREHPAATPLVVVQRAHEFDFFGGVVPLAGGGIDLPTATHLHATF